MTLVAFASLKGAPGVTTAAALTALHLSNSCLVELDPSGATLAASFGGAGVLQGPGTLELLTSGALDQSPLVIDPYVNALPSGTPNQAGQPVVAGHRSGGAMTSALTAAGPRLADLAAWMRAESTMYIADLGRVSPGSPVSLVANTADLLIIVTPCQAHAASSADANLEHLAATGEVLKANAVWLLVGPQASGLADPGELERRSGCGIVGVVPFDPEPANQFTEGRIGRKFTRSNLYKAAKKLARDVNDRAVANSQPATDSQPAGDSQPVTDSQPVGNGQAATDSQPTVRVAQ